MLHPVSATTFPDGISPLLEQIITFDDHQQSERAFAQQYLDFAVGSCRLTHNRAFFERMLDLLEAQLLLHLNYRVGAQAVLTGQVNGLPLKSGLDTSLPSALGGVYAIFSDLFGEEQPTSLDEAATFLLKKSEASLLRAADLSRPRREQGQKSGHPAGSPLDRGRMLLARERLVDGECANCLIDVAFQGAAKYPRSPWPRLMIGVLH